MIRIILSYLIGVVTLIALWYILSRVQMKGWLHEFNQFLTNHYKIKEDGEHEFNQFLTNHYKIKEDGEKEE